MFRSLSSKNSASSSKRKKTDKPTRRTESITSSSTHRKDRSSKHEQKKSIPDGLSGPSTYRTTVDRFDQLEPRSLTEEAIRSLGLHDDGRADTHSNGQDMSSRRARSDRKEPFENSHQQRTGAQEYEQYRSLSDEIIVDEQFSHRTHPQNAFGTSSRVQDQFPGQDPSSYARSAFDPSPAQVLARTYDAGGQTQAEEYFGTMPVEPLPQDGVGAAAEYYSQTPMQMYQTGNQYDVPHVLHEGAARLGAPSGRLMFNGSLRHDNPMGNASTYPMEGVSDQAYTYQQHRPTEAGSQGQSASHNAYHQHSHSAPSTAILVDQASDASLPGLLGQGKQATKENSAYRVAAASRVTGGDGYHSHSAHQQNPSAPRNKLNGGILHDRSTTRPYTSGHMATQHRHKGPISKFVDWWKDYEDVRKMEEYTEYIGVCRYCFDPRSSATDAPRKHYRGGRISSESSQRRSSDSLRRSYSGGSRTSRVDKDQRYHSSDSERRSNKTSWLGAGIAAYGLSKVGKSLWQSSRDFDDTHSIRSGRRDDVPGNSGRRKIVKNHSHAERSDLEDYRAVAQGKSTRLTTTRSSAGHSHDSGSGSRHSQTGRRDASHLGSMPVASPSYSQERINVRHPSPEYEHVTTHSVRQRPMTRSRSHSPSLGQILGLTGAAKRKLDTAPKSSSSRQDNAFNARRSGKPNSRKSKEKGFFSFANSSSSSANSDLAFGIHTAQNGNLTRRVTAKSSDEHLKATLLGIGATAAALNAVHKSRMGSKKEFKATRKGDRNSLNRSKQPSNDEEGWESATNDDADSISSGLAFGDFDASAKSPKRRPSSGSITSQSSGTDKWSWRWRRKSEKKDHINGTSLTHRDESLSGRESSFAALQPLQHVQPAPIDSPTQSDARGSSSMPGAFPEHPHAVEYASIQQPWPILPSNTKLFDAETSARSAQTTQSNSRTPARPFVPTGIIRTQSSPVPNHAIRDVALASLVGAATAGILSTAKDRPRDDSPSNVRFELTDKQAKKEERQQRKVNVKESKERAHEERRDKKERARLDRERALQEESTRLDHDYARRQAEEAEALEKKVNRQREEALREESDRLGRDYARRQAEAQEARDARELEADRQREEEIKEFMKHALAEQAREAEQKRRREAWQAQQTIIHDGSSKDRGNLHTDFSYATRPYEPSNSHSGQPLMDDDLIDPEFFTRTRSHSDLARHEELARKAAAKVVADLEQRYKEPTPSQAEFFAPKELFEPSEGKTKVRGPVDDTDYHVYHLSGIQNTSMPTGPPPPYQYANLHEHQDESAWKIPKLNVIAPTPPVSYAGSVKDDKSPTSASRKAFCEASQESEADMEPHKSSKVSWGEDQTRFYEVATPESSREHDVLQKDIPHKMSGLRDEDSCAEAVQSDDGRGSTKQSNRNGSPKVEYVDRIAREIANTAPTRFYQQPFVESVSDIAFTLNSPDAEGASPAQGFVEGEVGYASESEHMPHIPGGFDDPDLESYHQYRNESSKGNYDPNRVVDELQKVVEQHRDGDRMTKKERRKRDKAARRAIPNIDPGSSADERDVPAPSHENDDDQSEHNAASQTHSLPSSYQSKNDGEEIGSSTNYAEAAALVGAAAIVGTITQKDRARSPTRRKSEPEDFDRERPRSSHSESRKTVSQSTPTSPVYERRPSLPDHAFDDLEMLAGNKRPKKSKRNSLLNYPAVGSPLRSTMTWDQHVEPIAATQSSQPLDTQPYDIASDGGQPTGEMKTLARSDSPSPESERGTDSIVSAPVGEEHVDRRRKSRKSRGYSTSPSRSVSVAVSEPYDNSRKHKRRSHRDSKDYDDTFSTTSARSRASHSSKRDRDDEDGKTKKMGGILSLFRRKTSDDMASDEPNRSKNHRRRHSSEHTIGEVGEDAPSISRSRSRAGMGADDVSSRHSSSSRHRGQHRRDDSVDDHDSRSRVSNSSRHRKHRSRDTSRSPENEVDESQSASPESKLKHRHRPADDDLDHGKSSSHVEKTPSGQDQSFLVDRVEDDEPIPLPADGVPSSSEAPKSAGGLQEHGVPPHRSSETPLDPTDIPLPESEDVELQITFDATAHGHMETTKYPVMEAQMVSPTTGVLSPPLEHMTPARPIVPLRVSSSTAVPLRFRRPPTSPSLPRERSVSFSSSLAHSPSSPVTSKAKRPLSTEFVHSTEFRPLYLLERTRKPQDTEIEQNLPSLPPSRSASSSSLQSSEDWQSAAEDFDPSEQDDLSPPVFDQAYNDEQADVLGSTQTTPKAIEFPKNVPEPHTHAAPEYYSWSDMEHEEQLRQEAEKKFTEESTEEFTSSDVDDVQTKTASTEDSIEPHLAAEVLINQDPMATDVWGELSDDEQHGLQTFGNDEVKTMIEPEETQVDQNRTFAAKKRKSKKLAKLGTSSVHDNSEPVRENPAELARRREQDAQDAVDTWSTPSVKSPQESAVSADIVPLSKLIDFFDEKMPELSVASEEGIEPAKQNIEPNSPLLSRKKSKKGKKKQNSAHPDRLVDVSSKAFVETQMNSAHADTATSKSHLHENEEPQTTTLLEEKSGNDGLMVPSSAEAEGSHPKIFSAERRDDLSPAEESDYFLSKAERKKKSKKAKKGALSIVIPVVAAAMLAETNKEFVKQDNEPKSTLVGDGDEDRHSQNPAADNTSSLHASPEQFSAEAHDPSVITRSSRQLDFTIKAEATREEQRDMATTPTAASHQDTAISSKQTDMIAGSEVPPGQITLPLNEEGAHHDTKDTHDIPNTTQSFFVPEQDRDVQPAIPEESLPDAASTSNRLSWFSWLPGVKSQEADEHRFETKVPGDHAVLPDALSQEPFERLLEQPAHHLEPFDEPTVLPESHNIDSIKHDEIQIEQETPLHAHAKPEELSSMVEGGLADNTKDSEDLTAKEEPDTVHLSERIVSPNSEVGIESFEVHANTSQSGRPAVPPHQEPDTVEDPWAMPSKKAKKPKKDKKAKKDASSSGTAPPLATDIAKALPDLESFTVVNTETFGNSDIVRVGTSKPPIYVGVKPRSVDATEFTPHDQTTALRAEEGAAEIGKPRSSATAGSTMQEASSDVGQRVQAVAPVSSKVVNASHDTVENMNGWITQTESILYVDPSTATAEDEWALPLSKQKKKKGKKGQQQVAKLPEDMSNIENLEMQSPKEMVVAGITSTTSEISGTQAESSSSRYFETSAGQTQEQHFVTPVEESLGPQFTVVPDDATRSTLHQDESVIQPFAVGRSGDGLVHSSHENVPIEPIVDGVSTTYQLEEHGVAAQHGSQETLIPPQHDVIVPVHVDDLHENPNDDSESARTGRTAEVMPELQTGRSTGYPLMEDIIVAASDPVTYESDLTSTLPDTTIPDDAVSETISSKKSKKDKKKAKKTRQRDLDVQPFLDEPTEPTVPTTDEQSVEREVETRVHEYTQIEDEISIPEQEPVVGKQPILRKLSKEEKRKAKKASTVELDSPLEGMSEQISMDDDATGYFPKMVKESTGQSFEQVRLLDESLEPIIALLESDREDLSRSQIGRDQTLLVEFEPEQSTIQNAEGHHIDRGLTTMIKSEEADRGTTQDLSLSIHDSSMPKESGSERNADHLESLPPSLNETHRHPKSGQIDPSTAESLITDSSHVPLSGDQVIGSNSAKSEPPSVEDQAPTVLEQLILTELVDDSNVTPEVDQESSEDKPAISSEDQTTVSDNCHPTVELSSDSRTTEELIGALELSEGLADPTEELVGTSESAATQEFLPVKLSKKEKRKAKNSRPVEEVLEESSDTQSSRFPVEETSERVVEDKVFGDETSALTTVDGESAAAGVDPAEQDAFEEDQSFTLKLSKQAKKKAKKSKRKDLSIELEPDDQIEGEDAEDVVVPTLDDRGESVTETIQLLDYEVVTPRAPEIEGISHFDVSDKPVEEATSDLIPEAQDHIESGEQAENSDTIIASLGAASSMRLPDDPSFEPNSAEVTNDLPLHVTQAAPEVDIGKDKSLGFEAVGSDERVEVREVPILGEIITPRENDSSGVASVSTETREIDGEPIVHNVVPDVTRRSDDYFSPTTNSKKNKKKEKKAKSHQQATESSGDGEVPQDPPDDRAQSGPEPTLVTPEIQYGVQCDTMPAIAENLPPGVVQGTPATVAEDEWTLPIKQSKKEKRKAKKLKELEEPLLSGQSTEEVPPSIEPAREHIPDRTLPSEVANITLEHKDGEPAADLDPDNGWGFVRTPINKEKRQAKKALPNEEQQDIVPDLEAASEDLFTSEAPSSADRQVMADEPIPAKASLPVTTVDKAVPTNLVDTVQITNEDTPVVVTADERMIPIQRSMKEESKAKKLEDSGEPLSTQEPTDRPAASKEIVDYTLEYSKPAAEPDMAVEDPERVTDSEVHDEWNFHHKPSKKEKRKARKVMLSDAQQDVPSAPETPQDGILAPGPLSSTTDMTTVTSELIEQRHHVVQTTNAPSAMTDDSATLSSTPAVRHVALANATEPVFTPVEGDQKPQDIDFAATLAAGLQDSGFDPSLVIDDPLFHRRASPTNIGEADPGEITSTTTRRSKNRGDSSKAASPTPKSVEEVPMTKSFGATEVAASDDFSDALTAGLLASGFAADALPRSSLGIEEGLHEPDSFSLAISKRKKKGKKGRGAEPTTMETSTPNVTIDAPKTEDEREQPGSTITSPKRLANSSFFHTSEVSQFLPVRIDHPSQSDGAPINTTIVSPAKALTWGPVIDDEPVPTLRDAYAAPQVEPETIPPNVLTHEQQPTWSFDNLSVPVTQKTLEPDQGPKNDDPFVPSHFVQQQSQETVAAEPVSPVKSTTKDRTSYLFQSPVDVTRLDRVNNEEPKVAADSNPAVEAEQLPAPLNPGSPGPGHSTKAARRSETPQQSFRDLTQAETPQAGNTDHLNGQIPILRSKNSMSNHSAASIERQIRSPSSVSNHPAAPSLRRINRSLSGDLRVASRRRGDSAHGPQTTITIEPPPTPPLQDEEFNGHGPSRAPDMANIYEGWGDVRSSPVMSPTRPPSMRKRQSMHILDLEAKIDQLASENRYLQDAVDQSIPSHLSSGDNVDLQDMLKTRDLQLQEKDAEIQQIRSLLEPLQREIAKLTDVNNNLSEVNRSFTANNDIPYATLQSEHANARKQLQHTSQELDGLKKQHRELSDNMEDIVRQEIANALEDKNAEIRKLREELNMATQQIRLLQSEILASRGDNYLTTRNEDYFDTSCQRLCQHVQQWVLRFSKYSDNRMCRLTSDLTDEKIAARLDNAILDGSDVDKLLGDRIRRRDVFMSVVMTMIWEYVFTRYLFGMDREQRQKLKALEKILFETGPPRAVAQWRAITLTLLSHRPAFATQRNLDTEAVTQEIFSVLSALLPPPAQLEPQILSSLRNVLRLAVELSIEMRSQKAEYIMLPPLQPEYDTHGDLVRKVHFNAALMNERSGDFNSNDELERSQAVVKIVLFPLVVKKGDDFGEGEDEIVVCPAQVLVAGSKQGKKVVRVLSGAMDIDNPRTSNHSIISGLESGNMI
ncbi:hypothetical protein E4T38_03891 [Aureobasidium subglaciale]|nr:hypothetical protein E4T38_03891 [Aureobasidium subglaciale]KAI5225081.1 hypothetical protein E4T40_03666 [Aureobasidium subglaciale]KAI5228749.1 hypothetical protein E4T41_03731 [Aureobasidium subglaciale]KAI5263648.1 hypothetical protein E4T46_03507 [Aureobasidium subglaciale]